MKTKSNNRIRKSTKYIFYMISIILILFASFDFLSKSSEEENVGRKTQQIYSYKNKFSYNYDVNLIDNEYTEGMDFTNKNLVYLTDLIKDIDLNLSYEYDADARSQLYYEYEVIGKMQAVYSKDGEEQKILEKEEILLQKTSKNETTNKIKIDEKLVLNLNDKNRMLTELKQKMNISFESLYSVILNVKVSTNIQDEPVTVDDKNEITIDLAEKTTQIKGDNNKENTQFVAKQMPKASNNLTIIFDIIAIIVAIVLFKYASSAKVTNRIKNEYKHELNRLLKLCQDRIVRVNSKPESTGDNLVMVRDFGEIVKLSEELFKPILCYIDEQKEEAWFSVISNNVDYRYILKK